MKIFFLLILQLSVSLFGQSIPLIVDRLNDLSLESDSNGETVYRVTGRDPFITFKKIDPNYDHLKLSFFSFDYLSLSPINSTMVYFGPPTTEKQRTKTLHLSASPKWQNASYNFQTLSNTWKAASTFRFDPGSQPGQTFKFKNFQLREINQQEKREVAEHQQKKEADLQRVQLIKTQLQTQWSCQISKIHVQSENIVLSGNLAKGSNFQLVEIPIHIDPLQWQQHHQGTALPSGTPFSITLPRHTPNGDRLYSRWAIFGGNEQVSAFRYADQIDGARVLKKMIPESKKGIGISWRGAMMKDLLELGVKNVTVNMRLDSLVLMKSSEQTQEYVLNGKTFHINKNQIDNFDRLLKFSHDHNMVVSAILLIGNKHQGEAKQIWEHPDCEDEAYYTMPNLNSKKSIEHYTAALDFLAERYSREGHPFGRISNWILHNEVDVGVVWTNAGDKQMESYTELYYRSMRIAHLTARKYDPFARVFASFTHYWTETVNPRYHHPKSMLEFLIKLSKTEGDFEWGIAYHPYPQNLRDPVAWKNQNSTFCFNTPLITMSNIEVLDAWVKKTEHRFKGKTRGILLSEQGLNSPDYSDENLHLQAAGFAYFWNKIKNLDSIEAFQYHRWVDHGNEGGLKLGLWTLKSGTVIQADQKKPIWGVFKAAGTDKEMQVLEEFKATLGVESWQEIEFKGNFEEN